MPAPWVVLNRQSTYPKIINASTLFPIAKNPRALALYKPSVNPPQQENMSTQFICLHMDNRGITRLNKTFRQTTTSRKKINEPNLPLILDRRGYCFYWTSRSFHLAVWQGVMVNSTSILLAPQLLPTNKEHAPCFRCLFMNTDLQPMADPVSPPRGGSRQAAMMPESFLFHAAIIIPKILHVCRNVQIL